MEMSNEFDSKIKQQLASLKNVYPSNLPARDILWRSILNRRAQRKRQRITIHSLGIAASLAILITTGYLLYRSDNGDGSYTSQTEVYTLPGGEVFDLQEKKALEYVCYRCMHHAPACSSPDFQELDDELKASALSLGEIHKEIQLFGSNDHLLRAKARIETHRARIIKAMVQIL